MDTILAGDATPAQIAAFLVALRAKGESPAELGGMLGAALAASAKVPLTDAEQEAAIDIVGTGGDGSHSINVSTMAALVVAGAGVPVCKHGNRSASSQCGTADVLEQLGVDIEATPETVARCVREAGFGFCFARTFHAAFRHAGPPRAEIGVPTALNLIGPMANPGGVRNMVVGIADPGFADAMVVALRSRGVRSAWIVSGDGLDELTTTAPSSVVALQGSDVQRFAVDPTVLGIAPAKVEDLRGAGPDHNADVVRAVLAGAPGPHRDIVLLNAAAGLLVAGRAPDLAAGLELAAASIDEGRAATVLERVIAVSRGTGVATGAASSAPTDRAAADRGDVDRADVERGAADRGEADRE
jgi:anthranilate phosphoribosyltransferase